MERLISSAARYSRERSVKHTLNSSYSPGIDMAEKINYLNGLRGVAAINVMIMHFFVALAPAMVYGSKYPSHFGSLDQIFSTTPLGLIGAGNFSVCIFFVLSGYVLTQKFSKQKKTV